jgi:hypothetical protein
LGNRVPEILDFENGLSCVNDAIINDGVNTARNVVFRNSFLIRHVNGLGANIHLGHRLKNRKYDSPTGLRELGKPTEREFHPALILVYLANRGKQDQNNDPKENRKEYVHMHED